MTLQQLRYFLAVVEWKSFSRAAESLYISQPALSKQISLLEKSLLVTLFERTSQGVQLTEQGELFRKRVAPVLQELDAIVHDVREPKLWRIGALPSLALHYLPTLTARHPDRRLEPYVMDTSDELLNLLQAGELDAALVQSAGDREGFHATHLFEEPYVAAIPLHHPLAQQDSLSLDDLHEENVVLHKAPCEIRDGLLEVFLQNGVRPNIVLEASHVDSLLSFTAKGLGITFVPQLVADHLPNHQVLYKRIEGDPCRRNIWLVEPNQKRASHPNG
jgi:LysR family hydrogen peroxide-inducible transcriptional activator